MTTKSIDLFNLIEDERGTLLPISLDQIELKPRRLFVVTGGYPGAVRGGHGPRHGSQLLVLVSGAVAVIVRRCSGGSDAVKLSAPGQALWLCAGDISWQRYGDAASRLLVIADTEFSDDNYVYPSQDLTVAECELLASL